MAYLQRNAALYVAKTRESSYNTAETTGSNYLRVVNDQTVVFIPNPEKRTDLGRAGTEFATTQCNTYWNATTIPVAGEVDFNSVMSRLWLRAVGGTVTDATVVTAAASATPRQCFPGQVAFSCRHSMPLWTLTAAALTTCTPDSWLTVRGYLRTARM